ncbi:MAG TPA: c-type cytochrome [Bryobacteraceae bacterium]|nr:c-type cytochrome [Bryobacteraceae bacterium]
MRFGWNRMAGIVVACLLAMPVGRGQAPAPSATGDKPLLSDQVFKNVQVLKGIPVNEFMDTMGFFAASLGLNCVFCHTDQSLEDWSHFADDVPRKRIARGMIAMVNNLNKNNFGGRRVVTCYTCHHGNERPKVIPSLAEQYGVAPEDPNEVEIVESAPKGPSADQILDKYIQAIGGAQKVAALTSFVGKGTFEGYDTYHQKVPMEVYAKAPGQLTQIMHTQNGDSTTVFNGREGWIASVDKPVRLLPALPGYEQDAAKLDAELAIPVRIKQALTQWKTGFPVSSIDDKTVQVIQGTGAGGTRFKLFFDQETGLLARVVRYENTAVGTLPIQVDYSNYREVAGVKIPFNWTVTWTNGQSINELTDVQVNVAIQASRFAKPAEAVVKPAANK